MGQLIRPIAAIFAAGLLCFHGLQPQGSFLGLGVWIVLMMVWVGLMGEKIHQRTFPDIKVCSKEDYPKMIEDFMRFRAGQQPAKSVKVSGATTRPRGSASPVELVCSAAVIASAALGTGPVLAAAMLFQGHKAIRNPKGDWLMPGIFVAVVAAAAFLYHPAAWAAVGALSLKED